jgi:hypothetical protein
MNESSGTERRGMYGSGINNQDWQALRNALWPFIHASDPGEVEIPLVPDHLESHPVLQLIRKYRETGDREHLNAAGQILVPCSEPFGQPRNRQRRQDQNARNVVPNSVPLTIDPTLTSTSAQSVGSP